jgi:3-phosphoshikimate 1-carboxyvinyltransferase
MTSWVVRKSGPLRGKLRVPSDRQIGQEALLWAALGDGTSTVRGLSSYADHRLLSTALREMGVSIADGVDGLVIKGAGVRGLALPRGALHAADSESTLELLTALLAGQRFGTRITASGALSQRSLRRVVEPLRARGAMIAASGADDAELHPPVSVAPLLADESLRELEIEIPSGDAATKRALLVSGLFAHGITAIHEGVLSRDHTERALMTLGLKVETIGGMTLLDTSEGAPSWSAFDWSVPGDFSAAAFVIAAALLVPGSDVMIEGVGINPTRAAFFTLLRHAGCDVTVTPKGDAAGNEPTADIRVRHSRARSLQLGGELSLRMFDDVLPALALCCAAQKRSSFRDLSALRLRKPDEFGLAARLLRAFGAECTDYEDGCDVDPTQPLRGVNVAADETASVAWLAVVLGLCAEGPTVLSDATRADALYPGLMLAMRTLGATIDVEESPS